MRNDQSERRTIRAMADASTLERENAALKRTVEDLAHALRKANKVLLFDAPAQAREIRRTLERHGLLRDVDKPEMVAEVFGDNGATHGRCVECGAGPGEACTPNCEDRR